MLNSNQSSIVLPAGEFKGTFCVDHPCIIEGNNTTLWNNAETVIIIKTTGVLLKNLRIELINSSLNENAFSIDAINNVNAENVEIIGKTRGLNEEDSVPEMKKQLSLGKFRSKTENTFTFEVYSPSSSQLITDMKDIVLEPSALSAGVNKIKITVSPLSSGTFIYGDILLVSKLTRRFYISGMADESGEECRLISLSSIDKKDIPDIITQVTSPPPARSAPVISMKRETPPENERKQIGVHILRRGERININEYAGEPLKVTMGYRALFKEMDIDPYSFMLDETGITSCDDDFVYFGNPDTKCGGIIFNKDKSITVNLSRIPEHIRRVSFVYSIYQPGSNDNFSKVMDPYISISQNGREIIKYVASELFAETTIIFAEIYKHASGWKINTIGQGYREGLKRLCASYGLIVS